MLTKIYQPIQSKLRETEAVLSREICSTNSLLGELTRYVTRMPGKRIRPALALLGAGVVAPMRSGNGSRALHAKAVQLAAAVEMIHTATLLHDDVIDGASLRRGLSTLNAKWGDTLSVLSGDYLYSKAFRLLSELKNETVLSLMSDTASTVCEGEVAQIHHQHDLTLTRQRYLKIIRWKTASLMKAASEAGALLAGASVALAKRLGGFGLNFGLAFQILDDTQDLVGEEETLGKSLGTDLASGQLTLPLLYLRDSAGQETRERLAYCFSGNGASATQKEEILQFLKEEAIKAQVPAYCRGVANRYLSRAKSALAPFSASPYKKSLLALADYLLK